jgi:hypothetical protein
MNRRVSFTSDTYSPKLSKKSTTKFAYAPEDEYFPQSPTYENEFMSFGYTEYEINLIVSMIDKYFNEIFGRPLREFPEYYYALYNYLKNSETRNTRLFQKKILKSRLKKLKKENFDGIADSDDFAIALLVGGKVHS